MAELVLPGRLEKSFNDSKNVLPTFCPEKYLIFMALTERLELYKRIEERRGHPLIAYVTSMRRNSEAQIARDAVGELLCQLELLPKGTKQLDLFIGSYYGESKEGDSFDC